MRSATYATPAFVRAPVIGRTQLHGAYAEGKFVDDDTMQTFELAVDSYSFLVPVNGEITGGQWIERIKAAYDCAPGGRNAAVVQAIERTMLVAQFRQVPRSLDPLEQPHLRGDLQACGGRVLRWDDSIPEGWKGFDAHPYHLHPAQMWARIAIEDTPANRASLLWRMLALLQESPIGASADTDVEAQLALMQRLADNLGYQSLVTAKPRTLQPSNYAPTASIAGSLRSFASSLSVHGWTPDTAGDMFLCRPAPLVNPLGSVSLFESMVHRQLIGWKLPRALVEWATQPEGAARQVAREPAGPVVIVHPEMGVFLGNAMGLGFWSKLDPVDQPSAVTFDNLAHARQHVSTWPDKFEGLTFHPVVPDDGVFASVEACVRAGLEAWKHERTPAYQQPRPGGDSQSARQRG